MKVKREAVQKIDFIAVTTSFRAKLAANDLGWARSLKERRKLIVFQDEYMKDPMERQAINLLDFGAALLAGDEHQVRLQQPHHTTNIALDRLGVQPNVARPLDWHPSITWLQNHRWVQEIANQETFRTGESCVRTMARLSP